MGASRLVNGLMDVEVNLWSSGRYMSNQNLSSFIVNLNYKV